MLLPSLVWQPNNDTRLLLEAFYENLPKAGDRNFLLRRGTVDAVEGQTVSTRFFAGDPHFFDLHSRKRQAGGEFSHRFSPLLTFQQFLRYGRYDDYLKSLIVWDPGAGSEIIRKARIFDQHNRETQSDTRLQWRFATGAAQHTLLTGLDWRRGKEKLDTWLGSAPSIDWRRPVYGVAVDAPPCQFGRDTAMRQTGLYAQDQIALGPWRFIAGLRRDHASSRSDGDARQKDSKLTWRAGALYQAASGLHPYLSYSTSFLPEAGKDAAGGFLKPTTAAQVQAGVKYQPPGSRARRRERALRAAPGLHPPHRRRNFRAACNRPCGMRQQLSACPSRLGKKAGAGIICPKFLDRPPRSNARRFAFGGTLMATTPLTKRGAEKLKAELHRLKTKDRPEVINAIAEARAQGDLSENAEYEAAKDRQGFIEGRIKEVESKLASAQIIDPAAIHAEGRVVFGATVELQDEATGETVKYQIVGEDEADLKQGLINISSPIARALIGKEEGDSAEVQAPGGLKHYEIISVAYI